MKIKGAIFDMDGTLVDSLMFWDALWERIGRRYLSDPTFHPSEDADKAVRTMLFPDAMAYIRARYQLPTTDEELFRFADDGAVDFYLCDVQMKDGAIALLEHLYRSGIPICLASASDMRYIQTALDRFGLAKYFTAVLSCADIGVGKDRPDIYLLAKDTLGIPAEELCVFEDSFVALETAKRIGFQTVGIFDRYNFDQDRLRSASDCYLGEGEPLNALIDRIDV